MSGKMSSNDWSSKKKVRFVNAESSNDDGRSPLSALELGNPSPGTSPAEEVSTLSGNGMSTTTHYAETTLEPTPNLTKQTTASHRKLFGLNRNSQPHTNPNNRFDYENKYSQDRSGEELADNARVWLTYLDEGDAYDRDKVEGWKEIVDVLLVFAGLFSGVITTFVSQSSQSLQQDYTQVFASLLFEVVQLYGAHISGTPITDVPSSPLTPDSPFIPSTNAFLVNELWFTSLAISLSTALFAVLTKQWLYYYMSSVPGTAREKVRARHFRFRGLDLWKVGLIVGLLPVLLHLALGVFLLEVRHDRTRR